jgi:hypothetical protein
MARDSAEKDRGRKERVLHTRVPPVLERELRRLAESLRVPMSNVVRAILEDALDAADRAGRRTEAELRSWAERLSSERDRIRERVCSKLPGAADEAAETAALEPAAAEDAPAEAGVAADDEPGLLGFQPFVLATATKCGRCGRDLEPGQEAFLGIRDVPGPRLIVGRECVPHAPARKEDRR